MRVCAVLALVWTSGTACVVTQATHDQLKAELDATRAELTEQVQQRDDALSRSQEALKLADEELGAQRTDRIALEARLAQTIKDKAQLDASVEEMQRAMAQLERQEAEAERRIEEFRQLVGRFQKLSDAGKLQVKIIDGRMIVELATDILFDSGSSKLSKAGSESIAEVTRILAAIPKRNFQIEGHTDNVPIKSRKYPSNWHLASARAMSVLETMLDAGMPPGRVSAASYGEHRPAASNETEEGRLANRRIEIVIVPDLSMLPGFEELEDLSGQSN